MGVMQNLRKAGFASPPSCSLFYLEEQSFMISVLGISFVLGGTCSKMERAGMENESGSLPAVPLRCAEQEDSG